MSLLSKVSTGVLERPHYILMHGLPGIGKSTFASEAPNPIFLCAEQGTSHLNVARVELNTFEDFKHILNELRTTNHDYKTVVIDTADHIEPLIFKEICKEKSKPNVEEIGFGRGYILALDYWRTLISALEALRDEKGMNIIILAHTEVKAFNDPQLTEGYDRYQVKLHHKAAMLLIDRVEDVLFGNYKSFISSKEGQKNKAMGDGSRVIFTEHRPAFQAKNRHDLPFELPLSWESFDKASKNKVSKPPEQILSNILELLKDVADDNLKSKIQDHVEKIKGSAIELTKVENKLKQIVSVA